MSEPISPPIFALVGLRLIAVWLFAQALWRLGSTLIAALPEFDPNYFGFFARTHLASPFVGIVLGLLLWALARPLAAWIVAAKK